MEKQMSVYHQWGKRDEKGENIPHRNMRLNINILDSAAERQCENKSSKSSYMLFIA